MHLDRMRERLPRAVICEAVSLEGYSVLFNKRGRDGSGKCNIVPREDAQIFGAVYALTETCLECLDEIEGPGYFRFSVKACGIDSGRSYRAHTYAAHDWAVEDSLVPERWYLQYVLQGGGMNGLPDDYIDSLARNARGGAC